MTSGPALDVFAGGRLAGILDRSEVEEDSFLFSYSAGCRPEDAVSLTMPVVRDPYDSMGIVHPVFEMNLPEGALLERLRHLFAKLVPNLDSLALLAIVGQSQIGRLRYARPGARPADAPAETLREIMTYTGTRDLFEDLLRRYATYSGVSGMQPKVLLRATEWSLPRATARGATHIIKSFDPRAYPELGANEYFCMRAARHAGISTPNVQLSRSRHILAVERFDLAPDGTYVGCEDFCVLGGLRAHGRYDGSYELIAKRIRQFVSPRHQQESLARFFAMVALSCAVENGDAHLKNFSVLYADAAASVRLAPAYDLVATTLYDPRDVLALELGSTKEFPDHKRLVHFGRTDCGLTERKTHEILRRVRVGVDRAAAEVGRYGRTHTGFAPAGKRLAEIFRRGRQRLG